MKLVMLLRGPLWLLALVLVGCVSAPVERERTVNERVTAADSAPQEPQWVRFGVVEWVSPTTVERESGGDETAMKLNIRMNSAELFTVVQAVSQAGRFNVGDRVRLLQIGDFTRVTYWPYVSQPAQGEPAARMPDSGAVE